MTTTESLTDKAITTLHSLGVSENISVAGSTISAADKYGDTWTVVIADELTDLDELNPADYDSSHFALVVAQGQEDEGRAKFIAVEHAEDERQPLVWGL
jgi:hypothetical protein